MEQLTLEQAAGNHSRRSCVTHAELKRSAEEIDNIAFQAGAEWQKEQYKELIKLADNAAHELELEGAVTLANTIRAEIERLQTL
jgi:hypothetical protein